ncbi:MAG: peptide ABC transporter substrate-binding protein [Propionibacteriaceae bacterium]
MKARPLVAGAIACALLVTACGGGGDEGSGGEGGGTIHDALTQDVDTLLPMDANVGDNITVLEVVYSGLVRYDAETTEPYNYVAEDISSEDNVTWTIKIKDGWTFQNGEPVDAESFARAWNYAAYGPNAMGNNFFFERFKGYEEMQGEYEEADDGTVTVEEEPSADELSGLKVVDESTLEVELIAPFVSFPTMLGYTGFFPIAQECLDDIDACAVKPIGNGPFQIDEWEQGVALTASKWADYPGDEVPNYDAIEWTEYSGSSAWPDFQSGALDLGSPPPAEWESANNDPALTERKVERPGAALTYLGFPMFKGEPWDNIEFRKAISMAIDRETIIEQVLPGQAIPADSWVVPGGVPGGEAGTCEWCTFDPEAAKAALEKAGGWPEGKKLSIYLGEDESEEAFFKAVGDSISLNLGIDYEMEPVQDFFSRRANRGFEGAYRNNWFPDYPLNENYLVGPYASGDAKNGNTAFGYYSEEFEKLIKEGDQAESVDAAVAKYAEAEKVLASDFPTIPLKFGNAVTFHSENVDNVVLDPFSGFAKLRLLEYVG